MKDQREQLYENLLKTGKTDIGEIGTIEQFKNAVIDEKSARELYDNLIGIGRLTEVELGSSDDFYHSIASDFESQKSKEKGFWDSYAGDLLEKMGAGAADFGASMYSAADKVLRFGEITRNEGVINRENAPDLTAVLDELGVPEEERKLTNGKGWLRTEADNARQYAQTLRKRSDRYGDKSFKDFWKDRDYAGVVGDVFLQASESLPQSLAAMFGGGAGLALTGVSAGVNKYDEIDEMPDAKDLPEYQKVINAVSTGAFEALSEKIGDVPIGKWLTGVYSKLGTKEAEHTVKNGFKNYLAKIYKRYGVLLAPVSEGLEEVTSQMAENATDYFTGVSRELNLMEGVPEAFVYGAGGGAQFSMAGLPGIAMNKVKRHKVKSEYRKAKEVLQTAFPDSDVSSFEEGITNLSLSDQEEILRRMAGNPELSDTQKGAAVDFVRKVNYYRDINSPEAKKRDRLYEQFSEVVNKKTGDIVFGLDAEGNSVYVVDETNEGSLVQYNDGTNKFIPTTELHEIKHKTVEDHVNNFMANFNAQLVGSESTGGVNNGETVTYKDENGQTKEGVITDAASDPENIFMADGTVVSRNSIQPGGVESVSPQQNEASVSEQGDENGTGIKETEGTAVESEKQIPLTKDGKPDYNAMEPEMFAEEFEKEFGADAAKVELEQMVADIDSKVDKLQKKSPMNRNERAENMREIARLKGERDNVLRALERYDNNEEILEEQPTFSNEEEAVRWVTENSEDIGEVLGTYESLKKLQNDVTLLRWQQELQGIKINPESFYREGDRNLATSELKRGWLSKGGRSIDEVAHDLSNYGVEVTPQDIVDFMLENPSGRVRQKSGELDALGKRFSELASKIAGVKIGKPDSPTGRLFIENMRTSNDMEQLRNQIDDDQRAEEEVLRSIAEQREAEKSNDVNISEELDYKGNPFILNGEGKIDFGMVNQSEAEAINTNIVAPIRLSKGNEGYGFEHMRKRISQLQKNGYKNIEEFVEDVAHSYDEIRQGNLYTDPVTEETKETFLFIKRGDKGNVLYIELTPDGKYYEVNSGGVFKNSYIEKRDLLWNASTEHSTTSGESQDFPLTQLNPESDNVSALSQSESLSENKDINISGEKQGGVLLGDDSLAEREVEDTRNEILKTEANEQENNSLEEFDENGIPFVKNTAGTTVFGEIKGVTGLQSGPIKLSEGFQSEDGKGYGLKHIENNHGEQIRNAGFESIESFVEDVANNFTIIKKGNDRADKMTYLLELHDKHNNTLFVELSNDGSYWNVNSAGIFNERYSKNKEIVWTSPALSNSTIADATGVNHGQTEGETVTSGNSPQTISSENKDINIPEEKQEGVLPEGDSLAERGVEDNRGEVLFREGESLEEVNRKFNEELQQQIKGKLPKGHVYQLGKPGEALKSAGIPDLEIELIASKLSLKASEAYESDHPFDLSAVMNLPDAMQNPVAVFDSKTQAGSKVIMTELTDVKGNNFVVAMRTNIPTGQYGKRTIQINSIRSVYPKDNVRDIINWINRGDLLKWADKTKLRNWLTQQRSNSADVATPVSEFDVASKIVENYENPTVLAGKISAGIDQLSEELKVAVKKVQNRKDLPEGIRRQMKNGRYPGLFDPKTGEVYLVMDEISDVVDAQATMLHEVIGHKGIHALFGEKLPDFCGQILASMKEDERAEWLKRTKGNEQLAAEEYVAGFAEGYSDPSAWGKVKAIVKDFLRSLGIDLKISDNDLKYILWKAKNGLKEGDGMMDVAEKIAKDRKVAGELWRKEEGGNSIEEVNRRFNKELEGYKSGQMGKNEVFHLGRPSGIISHFLPDLPIVMRQKIVTKGISKKHNVDIETIKNMPSGISTPIFIFQRDMKTIGILSEMKDRDGKNICVAIEMNYAYQDGNRVLEVNSVNTFHGRDAVNIVEPIVYNNTLRWVDKKKGLNWISSAQLNGQEISNQDLSSATNIIKSFENPKSEDNVLFREVEGNEADRIADKMIKDSEMNEEEGYKLKDVLRTWAAKMNDAYVDNMSSVKKLQDEIVKRTGRELPDYMNVYMYQNTVASRNMRESEIFRDEYLRPLIGAVRDLQRKGLRRRVLENYLIAKHGYEERNPYMNRRYGTEGKDYSGLTALEAELKGKSIPEFIKEVEEKYDTELLWNAIRRATQVSLKKWYASGMINKETYEKVKGMYQHYVPLRGFDEKTAEDVYDYFTGSHSVFNSPLKSAEGRRSRADNPIAHIVSMSQSTIAGGNDNLMKLHFLRLAQQYPSDKLSVSRMWKERIGEKDGQPVYVSVMPEYNDDAEVYQQNVRDFEGRMKQLEKEGKAIRENSKLDVGMHISPQHANEHVVKVRLNGEDYAVYVHGDPLIAQAVNGLNHADDKLGASKFGKKWDWLKRNMAANFTTRNPAFVGSNLKRDLRWATETLLVKEGGKYVADFVKSIPDSSGALFRFLRGKEDLNNPVDRMLQEFLDNGGETGFTAMYNIDTIKRKINRMTDDSVKGKTVRGVIKFTDMFADTNRWAEDLSRFATYMASRKAGRSILRSVYDAKEVTVNFNRHGSGKLGNAELKHAYLFFNAGVQSMRNMGLMAKNAPIATAGLITERVFMGAIMSTLTRILWSALGDDGNDAEDEYYGLPDHVRKNNVCLYLGKGRGFITSPLPIEDRAFYGMGDALMRYVRGDISGAEATTDIMSGLMDILPLNPVGSYSTPWPDVTKPLEEAYGTNQTFTGMPVVKDNPYNKYAPEFRRVYKSAGVVPVWISEKLNEITGGDVVRRGGFDRLLGRFANPASFEHVVEGYLGGAYKTVMQLSKTVGSMFDKERDVEARNIPVLNRFYNAGGKYGEMQRVNKKYFDLIDEMEEYRSWMSGYKKEAMMRAGEKGMFDMVKSMTELSRDERYRKLKKIEKIHKKVMDLYGKLNFVNTSEQEKLILDQIFRLKKDGIREFGLKKEYKVY